MCPKSQLWIWNEKWLSIKSSLAYFQVKLFNHLQWRGVLFTYILRHQQHGLVWVHQRWKHPSLCRSLVFENQHPWGIFWMASFLCLEVADNWQWFHCNFCDFNNLNPASSGQRSAQENWLDRKVQTVSVDDVEYITCEHVGKDRRSFKLKPEKDSVSLTLKLMGRNQTIGRIRITQFGVNSNIATTGHKLQGTSKNNLIVATWNYSYAHWIYVVLSRVRTLKGLFLCQKLDETKPFPVIREVGIEEERLKEIETEILARPKPKTRESPSIASFPA